jgi:hypothetical protein
MGQAENLRSIVEDGIKVSGSNVERLVLANAQAITNTSSLDFYISSDIAKRVDEIELEIYNTHDQIINISYLSNVRGNFDILSDSTGAKYQYAMPASQAFFPRAINKNNMTVLGNPVLLSDGRIGIRLQASVIPTTGQITVVAYIKTKGVSK